MGSSYFNNDMLKLRNEEALLNKRFMDPGKAGFEYVRNT
jgi:hypothetical protein